MGVEKLLIDKDDTIFSMGRFRFQNKIIREQFARVLSLFGRENVLIMSTMKLENNEIE